MVMGIWKMVVSIHPYDDGNGRVARVSLQVNLTSQYLTANSYK